MVAPTSREEFVKYCLRRLGHPVVRINVAQEQIEDRVDDALEKYFSRHFDAVEEVYLARPITQTDITRGYIQLQDKYFSVTRVYNGNNPLGSGWASYPYQYYYNMMLNREGPYAATGGGLAGGGLTDWYIATMYHESIRQTFSPEQTFRFNQKTNRLYIHGDLTTSTTLIIRGYSKLDPEQYEEVWNDSWLKSYATALIKRQWGVNLKKFSNVPLPGGVLLDGQTIFAEAEAEIDSLETKLINEYELPADAMIG